MFRRWRLIGYFLILYHPSHTEKESSSTSHARNPFILTFLNSAQCLMVRRWRLIGYFPILYNPAGRDKMGSPALQHFNDKILLRACVCFQGVALRTSGQAPCKPQQVCSLSLVALQTTLHDCGSIVLNRVLWRATNDRARTGFFVDWRSWLAWSSYSLSGWCISTGFSPQSSLKCSCKRTHPTHPTPRRQRGVCVRASRCVPPPPSAARISSCACVSASLRIGVAHNSVEYKERLTYCLYSMC
jgi:hypothetical protein